MFDIFHFTFGFHVYGGMDKFSGKCYSHFNT